MAEQTELGVVVIGRNEGARLVQCLKALQGLAGRVVYVDSGSTDDSVAQAQRLGAEVVNLDMTQPFTAARARNAGVAHLGQGQQVPEFIQFVDGDCALNADWMRTGVTFLRADPKAAVACGRLREIAPEASVYNQLADAEWNTPVGETKYCGGIALMRSAALAQVSGFDSRLIAGEEPELCVRLRAAGWTIWRLEADMGWHDLAMTRFSQWWRRTRRGGMAAAQGAAMHGAPPERHKVVETRRAVLWGLVLPGVTVLGLLITPWVLVLLLIWPLQVLRLWRKGDPLVRACFLTIAKLPEGVGVAGYWWSRLIRRQQGLIEYK